MRRHEPSVIPIWKRSAKHSAMSISIHSFSVQNEVTSTQFCKVEITSKIFLNWICQLNGTADSRCPPSKAWVCDRSLSGFAESHREHWYLFHASVVCLSGTGFCIALITHQEGSYWGWMCLSAIEKPHTIGLDRIRPSRHEKKMAQFWRPTQRVP